MKTLGHKVSDEHLKQIMKLIDENGYLIVNLFIELSNEKKLENCKI